MQIVLIAVIAAFAVLGLFIGLGKGYTRVKSWGIEYAVGGILAVLISGLVTKLLGAGIVSGIAALGVCAVLVIALAAFSGIIRKVLNHSMQKHLELEMHKKHELIEWWESRLALAAETNRRKYKRLIKRYNKIKYSAGASGFFNRLFGGITLAVKGAVIACILLAPVMLILDLFGLTAEGAVLSALGELIASPMWTFVKPYIFDFLVYGLICISLRSGYKNGILSVLWSVIFIALLALACYLGYYIAFNNSALVSAAEALDGHIGSKISTFTSLVNIETVLISKIIIAAGIALLMIIVVIVINIFVPRLIDKVRDGASVRVIDGIFGAVIAVAVAVAAMLALGAVISNMYELEFMSGFNLYFENSAIARYVYGDNLLNMMGLLNDLPIADWLG